MKVHKSEMIETFPKIFVLFIFSTLLLQMTRSKKTLDAICIEKFGNVTEKQSTQKLHLKYGADEMKIAIICSLRLDGGILPNVIREYVEHATYCTGCAAAFQVAINKRIEDGEMDRNEYVNAICDVVPNFMINSEVCNKYLEINVDSILFMIDNNPNMTGRDVCSKILQKYDCAGKPHPRRTISISEATPAPKRERNPSLRPLRVLHITDVHYDMWYTPGSNAKCTKPLCCEGSAALGIVEANRAGRWADYRNCDISKDLITSTFDFIKKNIEFDVIYMTGDIVSHNGWDISNELLPEIYKEGVQFFRDYFAPKPVYPCLGNHDTHPINLFAPESLENTEFSDEWVYRFYKDSWSDLPPQTESTILKGGYYTTLIQPGLRIISLNSNVAYTYNFWLMYEDTDVYTQLQWAADVLQNAEEASEVVQILLHGPPGDEDTYKPWSEEFNRIIQRYSDIITGIFCGHTHFDEFNIAYSKEGQPLDVIWNGGSLTTFNYLNPNFKLLRMDGNNFEVTDIDTWSFNVTEANLHQDASPAWSKAYSFKELYGLNDVTPVTVSDLVFKMAKDENLRDLYYRHKVKEAGPSLKKGCNKQCQKHSLCDLVRSEVGDNKMCDKILKVFT